jgi:GNAT superfamily N-acetyltransferase
MMKDAVQRQKVALAAELGVDAALLTRRGTLVAVSARADRVRVLRLGALTLITVPPALLMRFHERVEVAEEAGTPLTGAWLAEALGDMASYVLPWVASATLQAAPAPGGKRKEKAKAKLLGADAPALLANLVNASAAPHGTGFKTEWEQGGFGLEQEAVAGVIVDGQLVAAAGLRPAEHGVAQVGVLTHPSFRRKGYAQQALALIADEAARRGVEPEFRALASDAPARRLAAGLGFRETYHFLLAALKAS